MFVVVGTRIKTRPVTDGRKVTMFCKTCDRATQFAEHETQENLRLYFVDVIGFGAKRVLRCADCNTAIVTDDIDQAAAQVDQTGTLTGRVGDLIGDGQRWLQSDDVQNLAADASNGAQVLARKVGEAAQETLGHERLRNGAATVRRWMRRRKD